MKIIPSGLPRNPDVTNAQIPKKSRVSSEEAAKQADCDKITIGASNSSGPSDAQLIASLKKSIMTDIWAPAPEQKINDLKQQIALNQYDINPGDIAKRLMHDSEADHD